MLKKLPHLDDVCFSDESTLRNCLERFANNRGQRKDIAQVQRTFVEQLFTYEAHFRRVIQEIRGLIQSEEAERAIAA